MRRHILSSIAALVGLVTIASAQKPKVAGSWDATTMVGPKDSVVATYLMTVAADGESATIKFPNRDAIPARVVATGGDSVVTEAGPYPSVLRPGQTVTLLHSVSHIKGDALTGTFEARYDNGDVVKGKIKAKRKM